MQRQAHRRGRSRTFPRKLNIAACLTMLPLAGCHSAYIQADVKNATGQSVSVVEVDYPSASFGVQSLPDGATYHYRFKVLGSGATKVSWTDAAHHDHTANGPSLAEGQEGKLTVTLRPQEASWDLQLQH